MIHESEFVLVQVLYSEGAQQLTDAEMQAANFEPVSPYTFTLQRQLDMLQVNHKRASHMATVTATISLWVAIAGMI